METSECQSEPMETEDNSLAKQNDEPMKSDEPMKNDEDLSSKMDSDEYEVEAIVDHKKEGDRHLYRIRWKGYSEDQDSWLPGRELNCRELLKQYKKKFIDEYKDIYTIEKIIDHRNFRGKVYYRIRWEGFSSKNDTWQIKENLSCTHLIDAYHERLKEYFIKRKEQKIKEREEAKTNPITYEVEEIINKRTIDNGKIEYLVHWKGYDESDDTWELEEAIDPPDLITSFEEKLQKRAEERNATDQYGRPLKFTRCEYEIEKIHNVRLNQLGKWEFFIELKESDSVKIWEEETYLDCPRLIKKFFNKYHPRNVIQDMQELSIDQISITKKRSASKQIVSKRRKRTRY